MSEEKTIITIITDVYCNAEFAEAPGTAVIRLTQAELDRIKHLSEVLKAEGAYMVNFYDCCEWFPERPLFSFDELGDKFLILEKHEYSEIEFCEETDPMADFDFERIDTEMRCIRQGDFFFTGYGKYTGTKFESMAASIKEIENELAKPEPTPRHEYYFPADAEYPQDIRDVPKYVNDDDPGMNKYCKELLRRGCTN